MKRPTFDLFNFARKRRLSYDQLQTLQMVAQQVVLSVEGSVKIPGAAKKAIAIKVAGELLEDLNIIAPDRLIEISIEAAARLFEIDIEEAPSSGLLYVVEEQTAGPIVTQPGAVQGIAEVRFEVHSEQLGSLSIVLHESGPMYFVDGEEVRYQDLFSRATGLGKAAWTQACPHPQQPWVRRSSSATRKRKDER